MRARQDTIPTITILPNKHEENMWSRNRLQFTVISLAKREDHLIHYGLCEQWACGGFGVTRLFGRIQMDFYQTQTVPPSGR